jgi:hypothetical protein
MAAPAIDLARIAFEDALGRIGFAAAERNFFVTKSGCTNMAMLGILPSEQIRQICKWLRGAACSRHPILGV